MNLRFRELALGFFGWFLIGNLVVLLLGFAFSSFEIIYYTVPALTAIVIGMLYFWRRNRIAAGIMLAVLVNTLIVVLLGALSWSPSAGGYLSLFRIGLSMPVPIGLLVLAI